MRIRTKDEIVDFVAALEHASTKISPPTPAPTFRFLCKEAAQMIRDLRPDIAFKENENER